MNTIACTPGKPVEKGFGSLSIETCHFPTGVREALSLSMYYMDAGV